MSELDMFKGNSLISGDLMKDLLETNKKLMGGAGGGIPRISIRGGRFRLMENGEQVSVSKLDTMNILVIDAGVISRTYYEGTYDAANTAPPVCWSTDSRVPSPSVPEDQRKASRCADCPMNVKGSGQGNSRACRFSQRLAVMLEGDLEKVYQLQIPATSIFGDANGKDMGMQAYVKFLHARNAPVQAVLTEMRFDDDSETPKLFFGPKRALSEEEVGAVLEMRGSDAVEEALTLTVSKSDNAQGARDGAVGDDEVDIDDPKPKPKTKTKAKAKAEAEEPADEGVAEEEEGEEIEEPKKAKAKSKPAEAVEKGDLASILDQWDD